MGSFEKLAIVCLVLGMISTHFYMLNARIHHIGVLIFRFQVQVTPDAQDMSKTNDLVFARVRRGYPDLGIQFIRP